MIIQFNFENNTQIPSVKVCIHFFGGPYIFVLYFAKRGTFISPILVDGTGRVGAPGRLIIWHPFKTIFFKFFGLGEGWRNCGGRVNKLGIIYGEILKRVET
jgi:hypothetical protein